MWFRGMDHMHIWATSEALRRATQQGLSSSGVLCLTVRLLPVLATKLAHPQLVLCFIVPRSANRVSPRANADADGAERVLREQHDLLQK